MCYSILIAVPPNDYDNFERSFTSHTQPAYLGFLRCYLPDEVIAFSVTDGMCACGLYDKQRRKLSAEERDKKIDRLKRKLKRKKSLGEKELSYQIESLMQDPKVEGNPKGLSWTVLFDIRRLMQTTGICWLFIYWASEETVQDQTKISISEFLAEDFFVQENVLYQIMAIRENSEVETG